MMRIIPIRTLRRLLRTAAQAGHQSRTAHHAMTEQHTRYRALISHLAHRDDVHFLPVLVPADSGTPPIHPLTILLCARLRQVTAERDAFRAWVTEDPRPDDDQDLRARAAEVAGSKIRSDTP